VICNYCNKPGHYKADCFELQRKNQNLGKRNQRNGMVNATTDIVWSSNNSHESFKNIWIADIEASCHYCNRDEDLFDHQTNGKVERKFQTIYGRIRAVLNGSGLKGELRDKIWAECVMNVTYLSNIISTKSSFKSPFELLYGEKPILHNNLKMFGEVGEVTKKERIQAKMRNRGTTCMFVGYTEHHSRDVYRMLNLTTNSIINS
jgi:hypothetical protein